MSTTDRNMFTLPDVKTAVGKPKPGVYFSGTLTIPDDCMKNNLCELAKKKMEKGARLFVEAGYSKNDFFVKAGYEGGHLELSKTVILNDVYFEARLGLSNDFALHGQMTLKIKPEPLIFQASIKLQAIGGVELAAKMKGMWHKPFNIPKLSIGNIHIKVGLQLPVFALKTMDLGGEMRVGIPGKEIITKASGGINILKPTANHFFGEINELTLGKCAEAFGYNLKLPQVISDTGFPEGVMVAFSSNPAGTELKELGKKIEFGFQLQGLISCLGFKVRSKIVVSPKKILVDVELAPINILGGSFKLLRKLDDESNGPKVLINIAASSAKFFIQGAISILGIQSEVLIDISDAGINFVVYGNLFGIVSANLSVKAPYGKKMKLDSAAFQVSACISAELQESSSEANKVVNDAVEVVNAATKESENKLTKHASWYDKIIENIKGLKETMSLIQKKMSITAAKVERYEGALAVDCTKQCKQKPGTSKSKGKKKFFMPLTFMFDTAGEGFWNRKLCQGDCIMDKSIASIKIGAKIIKQEYRQVKYDIIMTLINAAQSIVESAKGVIDAAENIASSIKSVAAVGLKAAQDIASYIKNNIIEIHHACFNTSLEKASKACFGVKVNVTLLGKHNTAHDVNACFEFGFLKSLGKSISDFLYQGISKVSEKIKQAKAGYKSVEAKEDEVNNEKIKNEEEAKKLRKEVEEMPEDDDDDDKNKKSHVQRIWSIDEIKRQMYSTFHTAELTDDDAVEALDTHPDYSLAENFPMPPELPLNIRAFTHEIDEKDICAITKGLVRSFGNISDHVTGILETLQHHKAMHKRESSRVTHKFERLAKTAAEKCDKANCTENQRNNLVELAHKFTHAHYARIKNLDADFDSIGKKFMKRQSVAFARRLSSNGMSVKSFLAKLKSAIDKAASMQEHNQTAGVSKKYGMRLNASFVAIRDLLHNDQPFKNDVQSFKAMKKNVVYLRMNIPCAA